MHRAPKIKSTKRYPSKDKVFKSTYGVWYDTIEDLVESLKQQYKNQPLEDKSIKTVSNLCKNYFEWLANELSINGEVNKFEVRDKLNQLF